MQNVITNFALMAAISIVVGAAITVGTLFVIKKITLKHPLD